MAKSHYCYLEKFNNYFNRKIIRLETLAEYQAQANDSYIPLNSQGSMESFDFNPNDNVTTEIIGNDLDFSPDYFLELDSNGDIVSRWFVLEMKRNRQGQWLYSLKRDVIADNVDALFNAPVFVQKGIVADSNPLILNSEGMIFNQIKVNETLLKDKSNTAWIIAYLSKNRGATTIPVQVPISEVSGAISLGALASDLGTTEAILVDLLNFGGAESFPTRFISGFSIAFKFNDLFNYQGAWWFNENFHQTSYKQYGSSSSSTRLFDVTSGFPIYHDFGSIVENHYSDLMNDILTLINQDYYFTKSDQYKKLKNYEGQVIKYLGKYYKLHIVDKGTSNIEHHRNFAYSNFPSLKLIAEAEGQVAGKTLRSNGRYDYFESYATRVFIQMNEISDSEIIPQADLSISSSRKVTVDQEFDILAFPAQEVLFRVNGSLELSNPDITRRIVSKLAKDEDANIYDVQLLPYCPLPMGLIKKGTPSEIDLDGLSENQDYDFINLTIPASSSFTGLTEYLGNWDGDPDGPPYNFEGETNFFDLLGFALPDTATITNLSITLIDPNSSGLVNNLTITTRTFHGHIYFEFNYESDTNNISEMYDAGIQFQVSFDYSIPPTDPSLKIIKGAIFYIENSSFQTQLDYSLSLTESMKMDSQCEMYRLLAPNYQGTFEFNVARNGGTVDFFTAYCTYKPYTPFIKVCPDLGFVYGDDYNDNRGLICGGDFSLPRISDAWQSYQLQNKNYQNIFNREIQNLEFEQSLQARQQHITGAIGIGTDSMKGAMAGGIVGGGWGALAGGIIGAGTSAVGYGVDIDIMAKQHQEAKSFAVDKFNYQLGNIRALPYTLTKVGAFDISSKIFPVLEHYSCSEEEKEALRKKIQYESMTIMAIGLFGDYYKAFDEPKYFKGELIRCDDIADDSHVLDAIYAELLKGVYM